MLKKILITMLLLVFVLSPSYGFGETDSTTTTDSTDSTNSTDSTDTDSSDETNSSGDDTKAPRGDLPNWKQVFVDDFDEYGNIPVGSFSDCNHNTNDYKQAYCGGLKEPLRSRWWAYPQGWPDTARQRQYPVSGQYNPDETVSIEDGKLKVVMKSVRKNNEIENQVAALVPKATVGQTYGRYAIRFKTDSTPGFKIAWLLWPDKDGSCERCEIDFPETELDTEIKGYMHHKLEGRNMQINEQSNKVIQDYYLTKEKPSEWHTAVIEWSPGKVEFFLDGKKLQGENPQGDTISASTQNVPDQPMTWVIQSESALDVRAKSGRVVASENSTATILIDWVAAYTYKGNGNGQEQPTNTDQQDHSQDQKPGTDDQPDRTHEQRTEMKDQQRRDHQHPKPEDNDRQEKPRNERKEPPQEERARPEDRQEINPKRKPEDTKQDQTQDEKSGTEDQQKSEEDKQRDTEDSKEEEKEQKSTQSKPKSEAKINLYPVLEDDNKLKVHINLENVEDPKGTWLISFNNGEPKRYEDQGASIQEVFDISDITTEDVPLTVEFKGEDADGNPIEAKITERIKVKESTDEEDNVPKVVTGGNVGGKLPKTDTNYLLRIGLGLLISLLGIMVLGLFGMRNKRIKMD